MSEVQAATSAETATSAEKYEVLRAVLGELEGCYLACSGGLDSMLLAVVAHRVFDEKQQVSKGQADNNEKRRCIIVHAVSPAVPEAATALARRYAETERWNLEIITSDEFEDERYLCNPANRCYYCKTNIYQKIGRMRAERNLGEYAILSGTNTDDLSEYRPGLEAAQQFAVRHPFVEADISKADIRAIARVLGLSFSEMRASPCLASRIYTGTRITPERLAAAQMVETRLIAKLDLTLARCRVREDAMLIEVTAEERPRILPELLEELRRELQEKHPFIKSLELDEKPYQSGRAFVRRAEVAGNEKQSTGDVAR